MQLSGAAGALIRALATRAGAMPDIEEIASRPWASITFSGARHRIALRLSGDQACAQADRLCDGLDHAEFDLGKHLLVDIAIVEREEEDATIRILLEALTIEDV